MSGTAEGGRKVEIGYCCYICGKTTTSAKNDIIFCDGCDAGFHQRCLVPVLTRILSGAWYCSVECESLDGVCAGATQA